MRAIATWAPALCLVVGLLAGDYLPWNGASAMRLTVAGDSEVRFEEALLDALRVSIRDSSGALARAGLRDGDLIVMIDGKEIESHARASVLLAAAPGAGTTPVVVLRAGARLPLDVDLTNPWDTRTNGGLLHPWKR